MIIDSPIISGSYAASGSLNQLGNVVISGSLTVTGSIIGTASFAETASYLSGYVSPFPFTGSAIISGSLDVTGSLKVTGSITTTGTLTAQTLVVQTVSSSVIYSSGSNVFGNDLANTQRLTGSVSITGSLAVNGSNAILTNQTSSMSASYAVSASYALSASFATTSSNALTASYLSGYVSPFPFTGSAIISGSLTVTGSLNASGSGTMFALNADVLEVTGSVIATSGFTGSLQGTASYWSGSITNALSSSFATTASYWSGSINNVNSASFATSASQALTASYLTGYISPFPFTGSAIISGSLGVTGSFKVTNLSGSGVRYLVADESGSVTAQSASAALKSTQAFTSTAGQTTFSVTNGYSTGYVDVYINGSKLSTAEFTDTSGTNIVLATGSFINDTVEVVKYTPAAGVTNNVLRQLTTLTGSAGQTVFSASYTPGLLDIFYNGSRLSTSDYTANNGTFFTLATGSAANDILDVLVYSYQVGAFSGIGGAGVTNQLAFFNTTSSITGSNNLTYNGSTLTLIGNKVITGSVFISGSKTVIGTNTITGSLFVTGSQTFIGTKTITGSVFITGSKTIIGDNTITGSLTVSGSQTFIGTKTITGSVFISGSKTVIGTNTITGSMLISGSLTSTGTITATTLVVQTVSSSVIYSSGSNVFGNSLANTQTFTGSVNITGSLNTNNITLAVPSGATIFTIDNTAAQYGNITFRESGAGKAYVQYISSTFATTSRTSSLELGTNAASSFITFRPADTEAMRINSAGNVLIGDSTNSTGNPIFFVKNKNGAVANIAGWNFGGTGTSNDSNNNLLNVGSYYNGTSLVATNTTAAGYQQYIGNHVFYGDTGLTAGSTYTNTERMRITNAGLVGIGTSSPLSTFVVNVNNNGGRGGEISIINAAASSIGSEAALNFGFGGSTYNGDSGNAQIKALYTGGNEETAIVFSNWSGAAWNERMRIKGDGNILMHSTSYNSCIVGQLFGSTGEAYFTTDAYPALFLNRISTDGILLQFQKGCSGVGYISTNTYSLPSDLNFKKNINTLDLGLNLVTKLRPVSYNHKIDDDDAKLSTGFIAQEMEQSLTELGVNKNEYYILQHKPNEDPFESQYWLDYTKMIPVLTKAIQEQQTLITALQEKLERNNIN
jgi:hypothetical protein